MKKEVSIVRKKIDSVNKELKPLRQTFQKKEREYKELLESFNEKNKEKALSSLIAKHSRADKSNMGDRFDILFDYIKFLISFSVWRNVDAGTRGANKTTEGYSCSRHQKKVENGTNTDKKSLSKFFKAVNADTQCSDDTVIELIHLPDEENSRDACSSPKKSVSAYKRIVNCQNGVKTLIIFKDVDATLFEDHGFNYYTATCRDCKKANDIDKQ
ncbi:ankyrin repeat 30A-like protein [Perilla frutescens var. frutescens]|nr:ankyrin repeat 30A-like protein [Perilla frutescens var. frutescens]